MLLGEFAQYRKRVNDTYVRRSNYIRGKCGVAAHIVIQISGAVCIGLGYGHIRNLDLNVGLLLSMPHCDIGFMRNDRKTQEESC